MQERKSTFSLLFFIKRKKLLKTGDAPVYMRVTVDGRFLEAALKRGIKPKLWNEKKQRSNGRDRLSLELNDFLDDTQTRILRIHQRFIDESHTASTSKPQHHKQGSRLTPAEIKAIKDMRANPHIPEDAKPELPEGYE